MRLKNLLFVVLSTLWIVSCSNENSKQTENEKPEKITVKLTDLEKLKSEASRLRAGGSVKSVVFEEGKARIDYVKNYSEYKVLNPQSKLTKEDLANYWSTGDAIEKALIDGAVRIMKKLNFVDQVRINLPYGNKVYSIDVEKTDLEKFIGSDFQTIKDNWDEKFSNPYVYNEKGRSKFFKEFGDEK